MNKTLFIVLIIILTGCNSNVIDMSDVEITTYSVAIEEASIENLIFESDLIVKVKAIEELTENNSTIITNDSGEIEEFFNTRTYEVIHILSGDYNQDQVEILEPVAYNAEHNQGLEVYDGGFLKSMESGREYLVYLSEVGDGTYSIRSAGLARGDYATEAINNEISNHIELFEEISKENSLVSSTKIVKMTEYETVIIGADTINYFEQDDETLYLEINGVPYQANRDE